MNGRFDTINSVLSFQEMSLQLLVKKCLLVYFLHFKKQLSGIRWAEDFLIFQLNQLLDEQTQKNINLTIDAKERYEKGIR